MKRFAILPLVFLALTACGSSDYTKGSQVGAPKASQQKATLVGEVVASESAGLQKGTQHELDVLLASNAKKLYEKADTDVSAFGRSVCDQYAQMEGLSISSKPDSKVTYSGSLSYSGESTYTLDRSASPEQAYAKITCRVKYKLKLDEATKAVNSGSKQSLPPSGYH
jgi:hypothetical protein